MAEKSNIEWTEATWNPVTGCTKVSPGCKHCYAELLALRLRAMGQRKYANGFDVTLHEYTLRDPLKWKRPQMIFVNSMSDLFHEDVPDEYILRVFQAMHAADWHTYQVLTKRSERVASMRDMLPWAPHIWMGVSVESAEYAWRIDHLRESGASVKFLSLEPLLGPLPDIDLAGIDWAIVGGESGPGARPMDAAWVTGLRDRCREKRVPFFFKQWGGVNKKKAGRKLEGETWDEMPTPRDTRRVRMPQLTLRGM
ncbi:hypothetical protein CMK11_05750 [Candidatus Poribacteria bacterium]|nr:hypothetical protein [Candidatus Poribacteria bacterium]